MPFKLRLRPSHSPGVRLRKAFEDLGPIFIKFGQLLSTRRDMFEDEISDELQKLQDQVPPFDSDLAIKIIEEGLDAKLSALFSQFDETPLASASLAQVHAAKLHDGKKVVVKVIRPGIEKIINKDLSLMFFLAGFIERVSADAKRLHLVQVVKDYEITISSELNLQLEAANTSKLRKHWHSSGKLYVPEIHWEFTRPNIMVLERIYGLSVSEIEKMKARGTDLRKLAHLGVEIFFTQVFENNFFHADMHPGNVFIDVTDPSNPSYIAIDCAIIGSLTEDDKMYLAKNLLAFFHQDYGQVARLHLESGWVPPSTDAKEFEAVIRSVCEPVFQKPINEISFGRVLVNLFHTARKFDMEIQPQLVLLQKTLINIEGLGRQLYPELDLWETAAPFMENWMKERHSPARLIADFGRKLPLWLEKLPELPDLTYDALIQLRELGTHTKEQAIILKQLKTEMIRQEVRSRRLRIGSFALLVAFVGILIPQLQQIHINEIVLGSSVLGGLGVYWAFLKP